MIKYEVVTLNTPNVKDYAKARNDLLKKSNSDWVLFLDSDEKLENKEINVDGNSDCYYFYRKNYFLGQYVGSDKIIRLVKKGTGTWKREVHEVWVANHGNRVGFIGNSIIHNTAISLSDYLNKMNIYSDLHAKANAKEGKRSTIIKIIFFPIGKFIITLIKSKHVVFSIMQSLHSFLSWTKLYFLQS